MEQRRSANRSPRTGCVVGPPVDQRGGITEAAVRLHTSVGPSETSFPAVAQAAGVTRLTLYRHFASRR